MPARPSSPLSHVAAAARWVWLVAICAAAAVSAALRYNIAAYSWDAGTVHVYLGAVYSLARDGGVTIPRWAQFLHLGLGSPVPTFRPPLVYAGMDLLSRLGVGHPVGWQLLAAAGLSLAYAGAYLLAFEVTGRKWPSVLGAVAFLYAPYVLRNMFERGTPEAFSVFLYPWVIWSLIRLARRPSVGWFALAALLWAGCIGAHVLAPLILAPVAALVAIVAGWRHRTPAPLLALLAGGTLTAFLWAPMLAEQRWVHIERDFPTGYADPVANPIPLDSLLAPPAVYDTARDNNNTGQRLGLWHFPWVVLGPFVVALAVYRKRHDLALSAGLAALLAIALFWMLTAASDPAWRLLESALERLQYRSRLMGVQALSISVIAACALALAPAVWQRPLALALAGVLIVSALPSLYVDLQHRYAQFDDTLTLSEVRAAEIEYGGTAFTSFSEFTPLWRTAPFDVAVTETFGPVLDPATQPLVEPHPGAEVVAADVRSGAWDLTISAAQPVSLTLPLLYYPRWQATLDGEPAPLSPQEATGLVQVGFPAGEHRLALRYGTTLAERMGIAASALTLAVVLVAGVASLLRRQQRRAPAFAITRGGAGRPSLPSAAEAPPPLWLLLTVTALVLFKALYVDRATPWLRCQSTPDRVCGADVTADVPFAGGMRLRGFSAPTTARRGQEIPIRLFWQADHPIDRGLIAFIHIRNSQAGWPTNPETESEIWAQEDIEGPGGFFTTGYLPGRIYRDEQRLRIPEEMPPGEYFLEIGWYDPATGEQLEPDAGSVKPPLSILWRSILLPSIQIR